jgi:hypothetical protein
MIVARKRRDTDSVSSVVVPLVLVSSLDLLVLSRMVVQLPCSSVSLSLVSRFQW